ncbi:TIGR04222 domain-containing membrane protein, partial [Phormidium sp. LEGE 05292]|uniref:TIGR04222 domain-containing membrane protein n=1 Tax=[Phormidium] sp. LEGE 05292 TaxID=767427 RepID=UPI00188022DC
MNHQQAELYQRIQTFSLDKPNTKLTFSRRLARDNGWTIEYTQRVIDEYKKFVFLAIVAEHPVSPSEQVDQVWHLHLTYTQSYWGDFCPNILQTSLHHNPTLGGSDEQNKFINWYNKTLVSYQQFFGEPPREIWPPAHIRFGEDIHFRRVNTQQNWILPKLNLRPICFPSIPLHNYNRWLFIILGLSFSFLISGCQFLVAGSSMNPLNYDGAKFLGFYILVASSFILLASIIRRLLLSIIGRSSSESTQLNYYEVAYLAAGPIRAIDVAIANLLQSGHLEIIKSKEGFRRTNTNQVSESHPLEQLILGAINTNQTGYRYGLIQQLATPTTRLIKIRLQQLGLMLTPFQIKLVQVLSTLPILVVLLLGIAKIIVGIWRDKPVGYLTFFCVITAWIGLMFLQVPDRTSYAEQVIKNLQSEYGSILSKSKFVPLSSSELAFAFALFGSSVLAGTSLIDLYNLLTPKIFTSTNANTSYGGGGDVGG